MPVSCAKLQLIRYFFLNLGLAHHPIKSLIEQGPSPTGLVGGLTRGLVGVVTKPLGGAAEFVAQTGQGLLVGSGWKVIGQPKEPSLPQHICSLGSSPLKYEWKLSSSQVLMVIEVTMDNKCLSPSSLILTTEAIVVVSIFKPELALLVGLQVMSSKEGGRGEIFLTRFC